MKKIILFIFTMFFTTASFADYCATRKGYAAQQDCYNTINRTNDNHEYNKAISVHNAIYAKILSSNKLSKAEKEAYKAWVHKNMDRLDVRCQFNTPCMTKTFIKFNAHQRKEYKEVFQ